MYTKQAIRELGVTPSTLTDAQKTALDEQGFFIVENVLSPDDCASDARRVRAHPCRREGAGRPRGSCRAGRAAHLQHLQQDRRLRQMPLDSGGARRVAPISLGEIKVHGANIRDPVKGYGHQDLHVDVPKKFDDDWWVVNSMIMFDDMTLDNGPTRVVPGSHRWAPINVPYVNIGDWEPAPLSPEDEARVPKDLGAPYPGEVLVEAPAGSAIICNSSMWHAGTLKKTDAPRRMLHLTYTRRDLPQQLLQLDYLTPELYSRMSPVQRYLLEIEPPKDGDGVLRQPKKDHKGWWN